MASHGVLGAISVLCFWLLRTLSDTLQAESSTRFTPDYKGYEGERTLWCHDYGVQHDTGRGTLQRSLLRAPLCGFSVRPDWVVELQFPHVSSCIEVPTTKP